MQENGKTDYEWHLAREGIQLLLNNKISEAEQLFGERKDNVQMAAGYCFVTFMVSRMLAYSLQFCIHYYN
jgi:hypothetical protein